MNNRKSNRPVWGTPVRHRLCAGVIVAILTLGSTTPAHAQRNDEPQTYSIQAGSLGDALKQLASQSKLQIIYSPDLVDDKIATGVSGRHTWREALQQLLYGSGLTWGFVNDTTVVIKQDEAKSTPDEPPKPQRIEHGDVNQEVTELEKIIVTGTNIRGKVPSASPLTIYTREQIEDSGALSIEQFARTIPQNFKSNDKETFGVGNVPGASTNFARGAGFNLRGLGAGSTLVLINGQRMAPSGSDGSFVDISAIPLAAVDRIDVLTDGASAIYGADAVSGVVNIVLRERYDGAETSVYAGFPTGGGGEEWGVSNVLGKSWSTGSAVLSADYADANPILARQRDLVPENSAVEGNFQLTG